MGLGAAQAEASDLGLLGVELETDLALVELELASGKEQEGRKRLEALQAAAAKLGYGLMARQAKVVSAGAMSTH